MRMIDADTRYYRKRLLEERERAFTAASKEAEAAHQSLAQLYHRRLFRSADTSGSLMRDVTAD